MKHKFFTFHLLLFLGLLFPARLFCQNDLEVKEVTFHVPCTSGSNIPNPKKWVRIYDDYSWSPAAPVEISSSDKTVAWKKNTSGTTLKSPIAIVSGSVPIIGAKFKFNDLTSISCFSGEDYYIRAKWGATVIFGPQKVELLGSSVLLEGRVAQKPVIAEDFLNFFPYHETRFVENFKLDWEYTKGTSSLRIWKSAGSSENTLYFTWDEPQSFLTKAERYSTGGSPRFLTSIDIGCKKGNNNISPGLFPSLIFDAFDNTCVYNSTGGAAGGCMKYWGPASSGTGGIVGAGLVTAGVEYSRGLYFLLGNKDSRCGEWRQFFGDILSIQGLNENSIDPKLNIKAVDIFPYNFGSYYNGNFSNLINKVQSAFPQFNQSHPYDDVNNVYLLKVATLDGTILGPQAVFFVKNWDFTDEDKIYTMSADLGGVRGQGNDNPWSFFPDHGILKHNGKYYDPSYGTIYPTKVSYVTNSIQGVGVVIVERTGSGFFADNFWLDKKINSTNSELIKFKEQ